MGYEDQQISKAENLLHGILPPWKQRPSKDDAHLK
jgi:hypothetical protein